VLQVNTSIEYVYVDTWVDFSQVFHCQFVSARPSLADASNYCTVCHCADRAGSWIIGSLALYVSLGWMNYYRSPGQPVGIVAWKAPNEYTPNSPFD
jgi:hypothetical protein